eukprot:CAMPEP_0202921790 /NCGR_PEP_ID=MMETSP1392-20130828/77581_1 /ASSEMBLY_ACC=CAM_ASM_000868 /TAXON_ID=225041 /ORGANISM="Chlamydomonas chlamydogama, Strain SAG 11-48b" /LENGTH=1105 /DNA_ID=CAMNT_0049615387 /DNA_START=659 /DNA_END=3976 /DNA_ORIENTATION=-
MARLLVGLLLIAAAGLVAAQSKRSIVDVARREGCTAFLAALAATNTTDDLSDPDLAVTVFIPDNEAFANLAANLNVTLPELLSDTSTVDAILRYHVVTSGVIKNSNLQKRSPLETLVFNETLTARKSGQWGTRNRMVGTWPNSTANVIKRDLVAGKSVVHIVDDVLLFKSLQPTAVYPNLLAAITGEDLNTLAAAAQVANLTDVLANPDANITVFGPTDEAFAAALEKLCITPEQLLGNADLVHSLLLYHALPIVVYSYDARDVRVETLLSGHRLSLSTDEGLAIIDELMESAEVIKANIHGGDGVLHIINKVLLPDFVQSACPPANTSTPPPAPASTGYPNLVAAVSAEGLTTLAAAAGVGGLIPVLSDPNTAVTLFAPTNAAFAAALAELNTTAADLLRNSSLVTMLLQYHALPIVVYSADAPNGARVETLLPGHNITVSTTAGVEIIDEYMRHAKVTKADIKAGNSVMHIVDKVLFFDRGDSPEPPPETPKSLMEAIAADPELGILETAIAAANLTAVLSDPSAAITIFAPTDVAFVGTLTAEKINATALLANQSAVQALILYHALPMVVLSKDAPNNVDVGTLLTGHAVVVYNTPNVHLLDEYKRRANVKVADIRAGAGVIHKIDNVLLPYLQESYPDIPSAIAGEDLNTLATAVGVANLTGALSNPSAALTIFAPTDAAFASLLAELNVNLSSLAADPARVAGLLTYHVLGKPLYAAELTFGESLIPLLPGHNLTVGYDPEDGLVIVDEYQRSALVIKDSIVAGDSIIHIVDRVLLPKLAPLPPPPTPPTYDNLAAALEAEGLTTLAAAVSAAGLGSLATNGTTAITLLAPTNEAFAAAIAALNTTAEELLANAAQLIAILQYHVVPGVLPTSAMVDRQDLDTGLPNHELKLFKTVPGWSVVDELMRHADLEKVDIKAGNSIVHIIDNVLLPDISPTPPSPVQYPNVTTALAAAGCNLLNFALQAAQLSQVVDSPQAAITVFAPSDTAFLAAVAELGLADPTGLLDPFFADYVLKTLTYHTIPDVRPSSSLTNDEVLATNLPNNTITVNTGSGVVLTDMRGRQAAVTQADIMAGAAVVHVIDKVLFIADAIPQKPTRKLL